MKDEIRIFIPGTVANVACGFDVLGFCLDKVGDEMLIRKTDTPGLRISSITGCELPYEIEKNVAGVSAKAMYEAVKPDFGFEFEIKKGINPGSGIGSSAASAVGSVFGMNQLMGDVYDKTTLTQFAMKGEALASQSEHADNIAPAIFGGFTLVRNTHPLDVIELPTPGDLFATVIHPEIEIKTAEARAILPKQVPMKDAIKQWANVGSLVHALHTNDYELLKRALEDVVIEPHRKQLIPHFDQVKSAAMDSGALGCAISGSGPSIFALSKGPETAKVVSHAFDQAFSKAGIPSYSFFSKINTQGIKILE